MLPVQADQLQNAADVFLGILIQALPFLILASLVSAFIEVGWLRPNSGGLAIGGLLGLLVGMIFAIPVGRRLIQKGAPVSVSVGYMFAAPIINPFVLISTGLAFGGASFILWGRIGLTLALALSVGLILNLTRAANWLVPSLQGSEGAAEQPARAINTLEKGRLVATLRAIVDETTEEFFRISKFVVIGAFVIAVLQVYISQPTLFDLARGPVVSIVVMIGLGLLFSMTPPADAFVALALAPIFPSGALLVFLVLGPVLDLKSSLMFLSVFRKRALVLILASCIVVAFLAGVLVNLAGL